MKNILVFIIIAMGLAACRRSSTITPRDVKGIKTVNIDKNNVVSIYDIFSKVEIIPLEMTEESALGYPLRKILVNDGNYYVLDYTQNTIFKFDSCGKYLDKINKLGSAPEEYTLLYDFSFNPYNQNLELMSAMGYINIYDHSGEFFKQRVNLPKTVHSINYFANLSPDKYVFFSNTKEGNKIMLYDIKEKKITSENYDVPSFIFTNTPYHHSYSPFYMHNDTVCFVQAYNGDVFTICEDGTLKPRFQWNFMEYNFDISTLKEESIEFYVNHSRSVSSHYATCFLAYGENSDYYITRFRLKKRYYHLILNKKEGTCLTFNSLKEGCDCFPFLMDNNYLYFYVSPRELNFALNPDVLNSRDRLKFETVTFDDNPIIIKYTFK